MEYVYKELGDGDVDTLVALNAMFAKAFADPDSYQGHPPSPEYLNALLAKRNFIAVAAMSADVVVGGLVAYELQKFEQQRSEIYIYDLAVAEEHRRQGVATGLMETLKRLAKDRGAYVIYVQADKGDQEAIAYYHSLGSKQSDVLHFDIPVE